MSFSEFFRTSEAGFFRRLFKRLRRDADNDQPTLWSRTILPGFMLLLVFVVCVANVMYRPSRSTVSLVPGQKAPFTLYASTDFEYPDANATDIARDNAANRVHDIYRINEAAVDTTKARVERFLEELGGGVDPTMSIGDEPPLLASLDQQTLDALTLLFESEDRRKEFSSTLKREIGKGVIAPKDRPDELRPIRIMDKLERQIPSDSVSVHDPRSAAQAAFDNLLERFPRSDLSVDSLQVIRNDVLPRLVAPNLEYDAALTNAARERARTAVSTVMRGVKKDTLFLKRDSDVTQEDLVKVKAHEAAINAAQDSRLYAMHALSLVLLTTLGIGVCAIVLRFGTRRHIPAGQTVMVALSVMIAILLSRGMEELLLSFFNLSSVVVYPAIPIALAAVLVALLSDTRIGMLAGLLTAFLVSQRLDESMHVFINGLAASAAGAAAVNNCRTRTQTFRAAAAIAAAIFAVESAFLLRAMTPIQTYGIVLAVAVANGLVTVILINLLQPIFESIFRVTTNINLLELSDLNHPLLKRLQLEAPGTYHHTLMVATLAEQAAERIGANPLLARVAAYFHDIGKLSNPSYFTENAFGQDRHADISPRMSALIILNHVKEGLVLAQKHKLRKPIREVIASHHGTSRIYFFYRRAVEDAGGDEDAVDEFDYRYPGPLPRSREAAIISLADSCEAASRSLEKPLPQKIDALVDDIFRDRILDGQLADCELNLREIDLVKEAIKQSLRTMLHGRIAYPPNVEHDKKNQAKTGKNEDSPNQTGEKTPPDSSPPPDQPPEPDGSNDKPTDEGAAA